MSRFLEATLSALLLATPLAAEGLGRPATPEEIAVWDIDVRPDGLGLPEGHGTVEEGDAIFQERCATCHGVFGEGTGRWPVLAGGQGSLAKDRPVKTIGSYWPYLSTVYDYVNRAMPFGNAQSLEPNEVYAITAYLMYLNDEVEDDFELSSANFARQHLPNEDDFKPDDRPETELGQFSGEVCMADCKPSVEITMHATVLDVTPGGTAASGMGGGDDMTAPQPTATAATETAPTEVAASGTAADAPAVVETSADPALVAEGETVFRKCKACHQIGEGAKNRVGPVLTGIVDHPAGAAEDYKYSKALQAAAADGLVWTETELAEFLRAPKSYMKGTKMSFAGLRKDADIAAIIAYLRASGG